MFITDGDPTGYDFDRPADPFDQARHPMSGSAPTAPANQSHTGPVGPAANAVKSLGSRVLAIGVGAALQNQASVDRLTQVSGPIVARTIAGFDIETTDVALIEDFDDLADAMRTLVLELCSPSLTIRKFAQTATSAGVRARHRAGTSPSHRPCPAEASPGCSRPARLVPRRR